ncbi:MAG: DUF362 domain-containing protein [Anaerolineae bacterium]|nr:DUF362 domain-containing protein [Anaerolineae bacterium]MDW8102807.1 DUF362 domain-containing protein [Anaerolineae bacterium]
MTPLLSSCGKSPRKISFPEEPISPSSPTLPQSPAPARVALVRTTDRVEGVRRALALFGTPRVDGKEVLLKPNFNSADPAPGSTHNDVLRTLVEAIWESGARSITVADRSGMGKTRQVMERKGIFAIASELGFRVLVLDELGPEDWVPVKPPGSHWSRGFLFARPILEADVVIQTCCLKTHRYGGHFTLSLKNSVGMVAEYGPDGYDYMAELHSSPHQRKMIAEINVAYQPALIVLDGVEAFVTGGPERGKRVRTGVILAGADRVAIDAAGVAILRLFGTTPEVERGPIFSQEQIARAVELGLGVSRPEDIQFLTDDPPSAEFAEQIQEMLAK